MATEPFLNVDHIRASYSGAVAVDDVTLCVHPGEIVCVLGANGAGKSTLLRCIAGLHRPDEGVVQVGGAEVTGQRAHRVAGLGVRLVPEGRELFHRMSVSENVLMGRADSGPGDLARAWQLFPELEPLRDRIAYSLSGGEQQMVAMARALVGRPRLVMLDEPSLGLAPVIVRRVEDAVRGMAADGIAVLIVEQDTGVALRLADRGMVLARGSVALEGTSATLATADLVGAYLGAASAVPLPAQGKTE